MSESVSARPPWEVPLSRAVYDWLVRLFLPRPPRPVCRHDWQLIDKTVFPSGFEQLEKHLDRLKSFRAGGDDMYRKSVVLTLSCSKCGRLEIQQRSHGAR